MGHLKIISSIIPYRNLDNEPPKRKNEVHIMVFTLVAIVNDNKCYGYI